MRALTEISKNQPRGRPFPKGASGNPGGRPRRTLEEVQLIEACREKTPEALEVIVGLMQDSSNERVRLAAAQFIIERGYGKAPERIELRAAPPDGPFPGAELSPREAYLRLIKGVSFEDAQEEEETPALPRLESMSPGVQAVLAGAEAEREEV